MIIKDHLFIRNQPFIDSIHILNCYIQINSLYPKRTPKSLPKYPFWLLQKKLENCIQCLYGQTGVCKNEYQCKLIIDNKFQENTGRKEDETL